MKLRLQDKNKAIQLRQKGYTYNEIRDVISNLSKSTLSNWLKDIKLTNKQKERILEKTKNASEKGRIKGAWTNKKNAIIRIKNIQKQASKEFLYLINNSLFIIGLSLYWAEGSKKNRCFQFVNSDYQMIRLMLKWLKFLNIKREDIKIRIYIHEIYKNENCENFWLKITKIPKLNFLKTIYKPTQHNTKKNLSYKGCCRIEIKGSELFWKTQRWQKMLIKKWNRPL